MIKIKRTHDMNLVREIMTHPKLYQKMSDDLCPNPKNFYPLDHSKLYYLVPYIDKNTPAGVFLFVPLTSYMYEAHVGILPDFWGYHVTEMSNLAIDFMHEFTNCIKLVSMISEDNKLAYRLAKQCGFVDEGFLQDSIVKNGIKQGQYILGMKLCQESSEHLQGR